MLEIINRIFAQQAASSLIRTNYFDNYLRFYALKSKPNIKSALTEIFVENLT